MHNSQPAPESSQSQPGVSAAGIAKTGEVTRMERRPANWVIFVAVAVVLLVWVPKYLGQASTYIRAQSPADKVPAEDPFRYALMHHDWNQVAKLVAGLPWRKLLDPVFVMQACPVGLLSVLAVLVTFFLFLRLQRNAWLEEIILGGVGGDVPLGDNLAPALAASRAPRSRYWILAGLAFVVLCFCVLERHESYYFVQDDVFAGELPAIRQQCGYLAQGEFPDWNPCQFMGEAAAPTGMGSLLYPPTLASYAVARWGLGDEYAMMEVFALGHLLAGFVVSFLMARALGMRPAIAFTLAISFVLCGYFLIVGRAWHATLPIMVWMPLLVWAAHRWMQGPVSWGWLCATSVSIAAFYYVGFPQYWFYGLFLIGAAALCALVCGRVAWRACVWPIAAFLLALAIMLPQLVAQMTVTAGMAPDTASYGEGFMNGLAAVVLPYPGSHAEGFMPVPANRELMLETQWYYAGTVLAAGGYVALGALLVYRWKRSWLKRNPWLASALLALWLGLGPAFGLWSLFGCLPVVKSVNHYPHRLLPFFILFCVIAGGLLLERVLQGTASKKWERWIALSVAVLMLYHTALARNSLWCYADRPYPPLSAEVAQRLLAREDAPASRFLYYGPVRSGLPRFSQAMPLNLATAYGSYAFGGYDPIMERRPETVAAEERMKEQPIEACRAYAVRWIIVANAEHYRQEAPYWRSFLDGDWCWNYMKDDRLPSYVQALREASTPVFQCDEMTLYELDNASPLAFAENQPRTALPIRYHGWGAEVEVWDGLPRPSIGERSIVVNILQRPWLQAVADGRTLPSSADDWGRMRITVPDGVARVEVRYDVGWQRGILYGLVLAALTLAGCVLIARRTARGP